MPRKQYVVGTMHSLPDGAFRVTIRRLLQSAPRRSHKIWYNSHKYDNGLLYDANGLDNSRFRYGASVLPGMLHKQQNSGHDGLVLCLVDWPCLFEAKKPLGKRRRITGDKSGARKALRHGHTQARGKLFLLRAPGEVV